MEMCLDNIKQAELTQEVPSNLGTDFPFQHRLTQRQQLTSSNLTLYLLGGKQQWKEHWH